MSGRFRSDYPSTGAPKPLSMEVVKEKWGLDQRPPDNKQLKADDGFGQWRPCPDAWGQTDVAEWVLPSI